MRAEIRKSTRQRKGRPALRRRRREVDAEPVHDRAETPDAASQPIQARRLNGPEDRERLAGGPQDKALYVCRCGSAFQAAVSASVRCPHCGDAQAW